MESPTLIVQEFFLSTDETVRCTALQKLADAWLHAVARQVQE